jgi:hypothetical protein
MRAAGRLATPCCLLYKDYARTVGHNHTALSVRGKVAMAAWPVMAGPPVYPISPRLSLSARSMATNVACPTSANQVRSLALWGRDELDADNGLSPDIYWCHRAAWLCRHDGEHAGGNIYQGAQDMGEKL